MKFFKDSRAEQIAAEARKAFEAGDMFFVPRLAAPASQRPLTRNVDGWAPMIQAVVSAGWELQHWTVVQDDGKPEAYPLFARRD